jgi:phosphate transport system protein
MQLHFQRDMEQIHQRLLAMSGTVERMIDKATRALVQQKPELAVEVIQCDEQVNAAEVLIEEECLKILALHQPVASDLRRIATLMKINAALERIADLACNIAERSQCMQAHPWFPRPDALGDMVEIATGMVRMSLDSFVQSDSRLARKVIQTDPRLDELNRSVIAELTQLMQQDASQVDPGLHCFSAARHIERIGDQAENIAEDVIYVVDGEIVRHKHGEFGMDVPEPVQQPDNPED